MDKVFIEAPARQALFKASPLFCHPCGIFSSVIVEVSAETYMTQRFHEWMREEIITRLAKGAVCTLMVKG